MEKFLHSLYLLTAILVVLNKFLVFVEKLQSLLFKKQQIK